MGMVGSHPGKARQNGLPNNAMKSTLLGNWVTPCAAYLDMPIKAALRSSNPFIRSLAIIDRRVGKRTLEELKIGDHEHSLVKKFYRLRMSTTTMCDKPD